METPVDVVESLYERVEKFGKTSLELAKLKTVHKTTHVLTSLTARLSVILMLVLFTLLINIGIALYLGECLGKSYYGFFIVAGFYFIAAVIFHFFMRKWIKKPLSDLFISQLLN